MNLPLLAAAAALALQPADPAPAGPQPAPAEAAFEQLKTLAGTWRPADKPDSPLRIRFYPTAGGAVLVESWERAGKPHSLTLYHRDGPALIATHYCPQGNQPRLALVPGGEGAPIRFAFKDATDLDSGESHLASLTFNLGDPAKIFRREIYHTDGEPSGPSTLLLVRE